VREREEEEEEAVGERDFPVCPSPPFLFCLLSSRERVRFVRSVITLSLYLLFVFERGERERETERKRERERFEK